MSVIAYVAPLAPPRVVALCDALEWLLVAWGRPHTGAVVVSTTRLLGPERVWTNKPPFDDAPEACLYLEVHPDLTTHYTFGGSPAWVLAETRESPTGVRKVLDAILAEGWQVQGLDAEGVEIARTR